MTNPLPRIALCLLAVASVWGCAQSVGFATLSDGRGTFVKCYGDGYSGDREPQASIDKRDSCVAACRTKEFHVIDASSNPGSITGMLTGDGAKRDAIPAACR